MDALQYQEPSTTTLLILSSFLLALHIAAWPLDRLISCGLIGQILVGAIWGTPITSWLEIDVQDAVVQLGFIGLILLVYEGGLTTNLELLKETLIPSMLVAITGIGLPIALSFILIPLFTSTNVSSLTAFAAGASLSSTSLGTTFAILSAAKLTTTRLGTVLVTAAMIDDVVGLVMVTVVASIGGEVDAQTIARPIWVSVVLLVIVIAASMITKRVLNRFPFKLPEGWMGPVSFIATGTAIIGITAGAGYAGTSVLFSAYLAGVSASYLSQGGPLECYTTYYAPITKALLLPFFFASIGFAIPLRQMFRGDLLWRGIIYALLMAFAKCLTGLWLLVLPGSSGVKDMRNALKRTHKYPQRTRTVRMEESKEALNIAGDSPVISNDSEETLADPVHIPQHPLQSHLDPQGSNSQNSIYAAVLLGLAMTTRGEIGFLIAAVAQSAGVIEPPDVYIVIVWGIVLCTLLGPVGVGFITRKIEKMEPTSSKQITVLGKWG